MPNVKLSNLLLSTISDGLKRKTITSCSRWSEEYRVMGKPFPGLWTFKHHPWLKEIHDATDEEIVGQKSAQMGYTETALNKALYSIDVKNESVLYILPANKPDAADFSSARFNPALELSPHLRNLFASGDNLGLKRAGSRCLYIRGSMSRKAMKSVPAANVIADEVDEMNQGNLILAFERMSGQEYKQKFLLSTPSITGFGINVYYDRSTKEQYFFKCPHCSKLTNLIFPDCIIIFGDSHIHPDIQKSYLQCKECKTRLDHNTKIDWLQGGIWVPQEHNRNARGFQVNQLYSMTVKPYEIAEQYLRSINNPTEEQEFFNSKLGETHEVEGAKITDENIEACLRDYSMSEKNTGRFIVTIGIDVGTWLHYEIDEWLLDMKIPTRDINIMSKGRCIKMGKVKDFGELDQLMRQYNINYAVIDQQPETRKSLDFCKRWHGKARMCHYDHNRNGSQLSERATEFKINANRTSWLDLSLGRIKATTLTLPRDTPKEYKDHLKAQTRIYDKDKEGNAVGKYVKPEHEPDHYAHARNYSEIALLLSCSLFKSEDINNLW